MLPALLQYEHARRLTPTQHVQTCTLYYQLL
jgi:hypothetical protein